MNKDHLIEMANQIGEFFAAMPDRELALKGIANHIRLFWDPRMRRVILAALDEPAACASMLPIVKEAIERARSGLTPAEAI
jgi:formate dehydrogenase subunit delta